MKRGAGPRAVERGEFEIIRLSDNVLDYRWRGVITRELLTRGLAATEAILEREAGVFRVLDDALDVQGFEPGIAGYGARWLVRHRARFHGMAVVTRNSTIRALGTAMRHLVPPVALRVVGVRAEGLAFLRDLPPLPSSASVSRTP